MSDYFSLCVQMFMGVRRGHWIQKSWSYRWLQTIQCRRYGLNLGPLPEALICRAISPCLDFIHLLQLGILLGTRVVSVYLIFTVPGHFPSCMCCFRFLPEIYEGFSYSITLSTFSFVISYISAILVSL